MRLVLGPDANGLTIEIEDGRVAAASRETGVGPAPEIVIRPGDVNAHTHVYSGLAPLGIPPATPAPDCFLHILERLWWRLDRALDADSLAAAADLYVAEALLAGTTTLVDHHESPSFIEGSLDLLADTCHRLGIRALLCYGATERNGGREEARRGLEECRRFVATNDRPLVRGLVGLHAAFTVSDDTIREAAELARELGVPVHVHVAEDGCDVEDARCRGWKGPLERLMALGALPPGSVLAHGVHLSADQVRRASQKGLWLVQNPRSNRGNGVGYPPALRWSQRVALGTDGYPSRLEDERAMLAEQAAQHGEPGTAVEHRVEAAFDLVAERFDQPFAPLRQGAAGDVVVRSPDGGARTVVVGGRIVVEDGRLVFGDIDEIRHRARHEAPRLWARMEAL